MYELRDALEDRDRVKLMVLEDGTSWNWGLLKLPSFNIVFQSNSRWTLLTSHYVG